MRWLIIDRSGRSNTFEAGSAPEFVVVLGAQVQGDQPSLTLKKRLDLALSYLNDHPQAKVIVSGAQGADEAYTEAYVMAKYLIEQGVDESRVIQEEQAHDTRENLRIFKRACRAVRHGYDVRSDHHE